MNRKTDLNYLHQPRLPNGKFAPKHGNFSRVVKPSQTDPKQVSKTLTNHVAIVLDNSGSMAGFRNDVVREFNNTVRTIRENAKLHGQRTTVSLWMFDTLRNGPKERFFLQEVDALKELTDAEYNPITYTPLYDTVDAAINRFTGLASNPDISYLMIVLTDGADNVSFQRAELLGKKISDVQATDRWTLAFQVPVGYKARICSKLGIPEGNVREWEQTNAGFQGTTRATNLGIAQFYTARSTGQTSTQSYYTDLSGLTPTKVQTSLQNIQDRVKMWKVEKEVEIAPFVEQKTGKPYQIGTAFYQLTKPEKVQANKQILVKEKTSNAVYGGYEARKVLGIPEGVDLRIKPGNHANFDVFCESNSTNRKLVRGTTVVCMVK